MNGNVEVVVIGGGYGGVTAANRLARRDGVSVTVVNPRPEFVERIRLHQLVTGSDDAVEGFGKVMGGNVRLAVDAATLIDTAGRRVSLAGGGTLSYDYLVYAVGSGAADPGVPGAAQFAHRVSDLEGARRLRSALDAMPASAPVTVVGAGRPAWRAPPSWRKRDAGSPWSAATCSALPCMPGSAARSPAGSPGWG